MKKELVEDWVKEKRNLITGYRTTFNQDYRFITKDYNIESISYKHTQEYNE